MSMGTLLLRDHKILLEKLKQRDTKQNIKEIKEEINDIMIREGQKKAIGSVTQLSHKCEAIASTLYGLEAITKQHVVLNNFIDVYKDMLSLTNFDKQEVQCMLKEPLFLSADFIEMCKIKHRVDKNLCNLDDHQKVLR